MSTYRRNFDETKYTSFLKKEDKMLERFKKSAINSAIVLRKGFKVKRYRKTKIKFYELKVNTNFHGDKVPKESSQ